MTKCKLLFVEDDAALRREAENYFRTDYDVYTAHSLAAARDVLTSMQPHAAVLDLILPDGNGMELLKSGELSCPTIILTTVCDDDDQIDGLDAGAKDYLVKPVSMRVLHKRLELRLAPLSRSLLRSGRLTVNCNRRIVAYNGVSVPLTSSEFDILVYLFTESDRFHTAEEIHTAVYGTQFLQSTGIKRHLSTLRYKLAQAAPEEQYIQTAYGKGYRFCKELNE